ncbi:ABC transporter permease [Actinomyces qiguomingii]|uniref:ABC transporter permease n=1 Tax=Actinomyces qiguomingii TaxID=2057800 RepID=UPI001E405A86|nr:ABC transporter permease [Actinomyces qiguomingii]
MTALSWGTAPSASVRAVSPSTAERRIPFTAAVRLELAKTRRLHTTVVVVVLELAALLLAAPLTASSQAGLSDPAGRPWEALLLQYALVNALFSPILVSVVASRLTDIEHASAGWYLAATAGLTPGRLCRAKLSALAAVLVPALVLQTVALTGVARAVGATLPLPVWAWAGYTIGLVAIDLAMCALHVLLAALVDNQVLCVGVGLLGAFVAVYMFLAPQWLARLLPWGYWALICPVAQTGTRLGEVAIVTPPMGWIAGFLCLAATCFLLVTARLDRIER